MATNTKGISPKCSTYHTPHELIMLGNTGCASSARWAFFDCMLVCPWLYLLVIFLPAIEKATAYAIYIDQ